VVALRDFARLSKLRFDKGVSGYLEVLVAENELFAAELVSVNLQASSYAQIVNVYQAVGGGWVDIAAGMAPKPQGSPSPVQSQAFNAGFGNLGSAK
jgi:multidrug efflux system outer membrane protein